MSSCFATGKGSSERSTAEGTQTCLMAVFPGAMENIHGTVACISGELSYTSGFSLGVMTLSWLQFFSGNEQEVV